MRLVLVFALLIVVIACQGVQPVSKPEKFIDQSTMENIIYDMTLITSARGFNIQAFSQTGVDPECYVFEKYEIDSAQFAQNTLYYSSSLEDYKDLIENVKKRIEGDHKIVDSLEKKEKRHKDSIRNARGRRLKVEKDSIRRLDSIRLDSVRGKIPRKTVIEPTLSLQ